MCSETIVSTLTELKEGGGGLRVEWFWKITKQGGLEKLKF